MTSPRIAMRGVALLACVLLVSFTRSANAAQLVDATQQDEDIPSIIHRSLMAGTRTEEEMIKYCAIIKNRKKKECITWLQSHKLFNATHAQGEIHRLLMRPACTKKGRAGSVYTPYDANIGRRVSLISSALRCKWDKLVDWSCSTCAAVPNYKILTTYQSPAAADPDGFILGFDQQLNAVVLTFRSTYCTSSSDCISSQWLNNLQMTAKTIALPTGNYQVHAGLYNTYATDFKAPVMQALQSAFALYPAATHNGLYVTGHSRGGGFAQLAAVDLSFQAADLNLTAPSEQIKLYTMGSLRIGDANYAALIENLFTNRYRIVNNADFVTYVPPTQMEWLNKMLAVLGDLGKILTDLVSRVSFYKHFGPTVLNVDVWPAALDAVKVCPDGECPICTALGIATAALGRKWDNSMFTRIFFDHQWYYGADMDNANCKMNGREYRTPIVYDV